MIFLGVGLLTGTVVFWTPTMVQGGNNFADPLFFDLLNAAMPWFSLHWLLPGLFYVMISSLAFALFYFFAKNKNRAYKSMNSFFSFVLGLYVSITFFFLLLGIGLSSGNFGL